MPSRSRSLALTAALATTHARHGKRRRLQAREPDHQARQHAERGPGVQRLRLHRQERVARAQVEWRARGHQELRTDRVRPRRAHRLGLVALGGLQHPGQRQRTRRGRRQRRRQGPACGQRTGQHRLRRAGLRRRLPAQGRQAAPLHLHRLRAEDRQARHSRRRHRRAGGLHDQRQQARRGDASPRSTGAPSSDGRLHAASTRRATPLPARAGVVSATPRRRARPRSCRCRSAPPRRCPRTRRSGCRPRGRARRTW